MTEETLDTLAEFHMHNPDDRIYALIAHLVNALETYSQNNIQQAFLNVSNILGEVEATRILQLLCRVYHVDYLQLMEDCQKVTLRRVSPRLLLHLAILPVPFVASKLQIDHYWALQLLDQFHKHFTIDDPILWLKRVLTISHQERARYSQVRKDLLLGREVTSTPTDTAEHRRMKNRWRRLKPGLRPPDFN